MFRRVPKSDWKQRGDVRLRVARLQLPMDTDQDRRGPVSLSRALWRRPSRTMRRFPAVSRWLRRLRIPRPDGRA
jgi:hypothetical protein